MGKKAVSFVTILLALCFSLSMVLVGFNFGKKETQNSNMEVSAELFDLCDKSMSEKAGEIATSAVEFLFGNEQGAVNVSSVFHSIFAGMGYVNTAVAFMKLVGIMKDSNSEALARIQEQLSMIDDKLNVMDAKLDSIISSMSELKANMTFNMRTSSAITYRKNFNDFKRDYCTKGIDPLITEFEAMRINGMKSWYNAESASERVGAIDNSKVILLYELNENNEYVLSYSTQNSAPVDYEGRYLEFSSEFLPTKNDVAHWNIDTYKTNLQNYIVTAIEANFIDIVSHNYEAFTPEGVMHGLLSEDLIKRTAEDVVNVLIYRTAATEVNKDARFALKVLDAFENYSKELLKSETGFDSVIRALYFTHTFEFETKEAIKEIFAELAIETTYYGAFVKDIIGMSSDVEQAKRDAFDQSYCETLIKLEGTKNNSLTGKDNYCYLTNTELYYGVVSMSASAQIKTTADGSSDAYCSYSATPFSINAYKGNAGEGTSYSQNNLVGSDAASLISLTLRSNGVLANHSYWEQKLCENAIEDCGSLVVALNGETNLPLDSTMSLVARNVIGEYFTTNSTVTLRSLPSKAESQYVCYHKMVEGATMNFSSNALSSNVPLAALALYGESHTLWWDDESAFMSGSNSSSKITRIYNVVCTKNYGKKAYDHNYSITVRYNCLISTPLETSLYNSIGGTNPLASYVFENEKMNADIEAYTEAMQIVKPILIALATILSVAVAAMVIVFIVRKIQRNDAE